MRHLKTRCTAKEWLKNAQIQIPHIDTAHLFARVIPNKDPFDCLRALLHYHENHCGGLPWFVLRGGSVELRTPWRAGSSLYRFRLWPLCRLAVQCGILVDMPIALRAGVEANENETAEDDE